MTQNLPKVFIKIIEWSVFLLMLILTALLLSPLLPTDYVVSPYVIVSNSMHPAVSRGDMVFSFPIDKTFLELGDIIAFSSPSDPGTVIVHRVVAKERDGYKTKGDNNSVSDNWTVTDSQVIGRIGFTIPHFGHLVSSIQSPRGFALIIGLPALLLLVLQIKKIFEGIEEEIQKRARMTLEKELVTPDKFVRTIL